MTKLIPKIKMLSASNKSLVEFLKSDIVNNVAYDHLANILDIMGYVSRSYKPLTASHVSNFMRNHLGISRVFHYEKPNYKGRNHYTCAKEKSAKTPDYV